MTPNIDFDGINRAALALGRSFFEDLIPGGKCRSLEYIVKNPRRDDKTPGSFSVNYRSGVWKDFATGDGGGDPVSLVAYCRNCSPGDAARELAEKLGAPLFKHGSNGANGARPVQVAASIVTEPEPKVYAWGNDGPPLGMTRRVGMSIAVTARRYASRSSAAPTAM
jgi:hypothetical protein